MPIEKVLMKNICNLLQTEMEDILESLMCGPRSKEQINVAETVLTQLCRLTGEECSLESPNNGVQRVMVFLADQIGVWAVDTVEEADQAIVEKKRRELYGQETAGDKEDEDDDVDGNSPKVQRKKGKYPKSSQDKIGHGDAFKSKALPAGASRRDSKTGKPQGTRASDDSKRPGRTKDGEIKQKGKQDDTRKPTTQKSPHEESRGKPDDKGDGGKKEKNDSKKPLRVSGQSSGVKKPNRTSTSTTRMSPKRRDSNVSKARPSVSKRPSTGDSTGALKTEIKPRPSTVNAGMRPSGQPTTGASKNVRPSTQGASRPSTSSDIRKKKTGDMLGIYLSKVISETIPLPKNPRQEALQEVISGKLRGTMHSRDDETSEAINAASVSVSAFIDKLAATIDLEYGQRGQMPPKTGTIFSVKRSSNEFAVSPLSFKESRLKIYKARGLPLPGKERTKDSPKNEWAVWTDDAAALANQWAKWLDKTVTGAVLESEKRKAGQGVDPKEWKDWKTATETEALEWRKTRKQLNAQAELMREKMKS